MADLDWFGTADVIAVHRIVVRAPVAKVFDVLTAHRRWPDWFASVAWVREGDRVKGVGAGRTVRVPPLTVEERFFVWDAPTRYAFTITEINFPVVRQMAEDWHLVEADGETVVVNTVAAILPAALRPARPVVGAAMRHLTKRGPEGLKAYVEESPPMTPS